MCNVGAMQRQQVRALVRPAPSLSPPPHTHTHLFSPRPSHPSPQLLSTLVACMRVSLARTLWVCVCVAACVCGNVQRGTGQRELHGPAGLGRPPQELHRPGHGRVPHDVHLCRVWTKFIHKPLQHREGRSCVGGQHKGECGGAVGEGRGGDGGCVGRGEGEGEGGRGKGGGGRGQCCAPLPTAMCNTAVGSVVCVRVCGMLCFWTPASVDSRCRGAGAGQRAVHMAWPLHQHSTTLTLVHTLPAAVLGTQVPCPQSLHRSQGPHPYTPL